MQNRLKSAKGFSLVELMIVVAIIGILSAIAIPNYQRFQRKARQSEIKSTLTGIFSAEKAFHAEWEQYHADLDVVGFSADGQLRYLAGFAAAGVATSTIPGYFGTAETGNFNTNLLCATATSQCTDVSALAVADYGGSVVAPAGTGNAAVFTAAGAGNLGGAAVDVWSIDHQKLLSNPVSGIE